MYERLGQKMYRKCMKDQFEIVCETGLENVSKKMYERQDRKCI